MDDKRYVILVPEIQENPDEEEAHVFRLETDANNEEILVDVEEEELKRSRRFGSGKYGSGFVRCGQCL